MIYNKKVRQYKTQKSSFFKVKVNLVVAQLKNNQHCGSFILFKNKKQKRVHSDVPFHQADYLDKHFIISLALCCHPAMGTE